MFRQFWKWYKGLGNKGQFGLEALWLPLAIGGATAGLGALGGAMNEKGKATPGGWQPMYQEEITPYGRYMEDYLSKGLSALQEGKPPTWFQQWRPLEQSQRMNALRGSYWGAGAGAAGGNQFGPGILAQQKAADVAAGRRGAGAGSNYAKQLQAYAQQSQEIEDWLSQLGAQSMATQESQYLTAGQPLMKRGITYGQYEGTPYQPSGLEQIAGGVQSLLPYMMGAMGSAMGGYKAPTSTTDPFSIASTFNPQDITMQSGFNQLYGGFIKP